jgi:peroxiredoxin
MKRTIFLLALISILSACNDKQKFIFEGVTKGTKEKYIYLSRIDVNTPISIDSVKIDKKGNFRFKVKATETDFYEVGFSSKDFITILTGPGEKIKVVFEGKNLYEKYTIIGSPETEKLKMLDMKLAETKRKLDSLGTIYNKTSSEPGFDTKGPLLEAEFNSLIKEQRRNNIEFILNNTKSLASIKALYQKINPETNVLYDQRDLQYFKIVTDSLKHYYPNSKQVQALTRDFEKEMKLMYSNQIAKIAKDLPETKLDPDLKDVNGKRIKMSSIKGKYVLLTFWSFQSKECIEENLQLKSFYNIYSKKGFEIYQINLDESEANWKAAVKFDELPWINTREDDVLKPYNARLFNVKTLPTNYLFNKNGQIIATDLHGRSLQMKLEQLFNK